MDSRVMVVVKRALDFQLLLQITLKLPINVVHDWLIAAGQTYLVLISYLVFHKSETESIF